LERRRKSRCRRDAGGRMPIVVPLWWVKAFGSKTVEKYGPYRQLSFPNAFVGNPEPVQALDTPPDRTRLGLSFGRPPDCGSRAGSGGPPEACGYDKRGGYADTSFALFYIHIFRNVTYELFWTGLTKLHISLRYINRFPQKAF
jgi:hypothetical protein